MIKLHKDVDTMTYSDIKKAVETLKLLKRRYDVLIANVNDLEIKSPAEAAEDFMITAHMLFENYEA